MNWLRGAYYAAIGQPPDGERWRSTTTASDHTLTATIATGKRNQYRRAAYSLNRVGTGLLFASVSYGLIINYIPELGLEIIGLIIFLSVVGLIVTETGQQKPSPNASASTKST